MLKESLLSATEPVLHAQSSGDGPRTSDAQVTRMSRDRGKGSNMKNIQMFLHGGESSIVTEQGDYNVQRLVPRFLRLCLNWTKDTFPSVIRLSWTALMSMFVVVKLVTIALFAGILSSMDQGNQCVANAYSYMDYFYFVVQTAFTIGYGNMYPVCHSSNLLVTVISFVGMFEMATFTGIFFAKFSMDPRRNYACAFSTILVGIPPVSTMSENGSEMVKFNFRFVNVFHRQFFKVSARLFLIEHRMNSVTERWLAPLVEELDCYDASSPLEFMSIPIEVCAYVPYARLIRPLMSHRPSSVSPSMVPMLQSNLAGHRSLQSTPSLDSNDQTNHTWTRYISKTIKMQGQEPSNYKSIRNVPKAQTASSDIPTDSEYELVCSLVFTDATTGSELAVRKSWPLSETKWLHDTECSVMWTNVVSRDEKSDKYYVDVSGLDGIENDHSVLWSVDEDRMPSSASPMAYRLINSMTIPAGKGHREPRSPSRTRAMDLFSSIPEEPRFFPDNNGTV